MAQARIIRIDRFLKAEEILSILETAKIIVRLLAEDGQYSFVAGRGVNKSALKKFKLKDEAKRVGASDA